MLYISNYGTGSGLGDVVGPASSTDNAIARFDSTTGKVIQNSTVTLEDDGTINNVNSIKLDTTYTGTPVEGELYWNSTDKTLNVRTGISDNTIQVGRENGVYATNNTGSTISNGQVVYILSSTGSLPTVALAQANDYTKSYKTIGIATMDITNGSSGIITTFGMVHDLNTSGFTAGDVLYLSNSVSGGIQNTSPTGINYTLELGICVTSHLTTGIILVNPKVIRAIESDEFKVVDSTDKTKQAAFVVSGITSGTKRQYTLPNLDTTLVGLTTTDTLTNKSISLGTNTIISTFAQLNTAVTDADLARTDAANTFTGTQTITQIDMGNTDTSITRSAAGVIAVEGVVVPTVSSTSTLTNKRITSRVGTTTSSATPTINTDNYDIYSLTAQTVDITSFTTNLTGTPTDGQKLWIQITGTAARAITWGASFEASTVALPTTTVTTARLDVGFIYNSATSKWRCVASC